MTTDATSVTLVVTAKKDLTADLVVRELGRAGAGTGTGTGTGRVHRIDPADVPRALEIEADLKSGAFRLRDRYRTTHSDDITAVYWRKPQASGQDEHVAALFGLLFTLDTPLWVNHPWHNERAAHKPPQLIQARRSGLAVPDTLISSERETALKFMESGEFRVITKTLRQQQGALEPARIAAPEDAETGLILLQQYVEKDFDVRLTVVGEQFFAARIVSPPGVTDWRQPSPGTLTFEALREIPPDVRRGVSSYMEFYGLRYGAFDFAVDRQGCWWFLECNPNGQYGFIEYATGLKISRALAHLLLRPAPLPSANLPPADIGGGRRFVGQG
ncbi:hypothetical protein [Streptomyces flavofungini]|uniref:hypothetical protein n=1 Tax=Streptomyces flavofungini TaxID=68200 RepID=UPI0034DF07AA